MPKKRTADAELILPTELEEHLGEVSDPRGQEDKIAKANELLRSFHEDMNRGRLPATTLDQVRHAVSTLGHYSGYPREAFEMDCYLDSKFAEASYRGVADSLPSYTDQMNARIRIRIERLSAPPSMSIEPQGRVV